MMACGRLHGPKTEAIPGAGDGHAQHVAVLVDCGNHGGHDDGERQVVAGYRVGGPGEEEGDAGS